MTDDPRRAAVGVAAYGLNPRATGACKAVIGAGRWSGLMEIVRAQRLTGLMAKMAADGVLNLESDQQAEATSANESAMALAVLLERRLLDIVEAFEQGGIDYRILKGPAFARLHYGNLSLRPFGDIDIMVRATDIDRAVVLVEAMGGERRFREPRPGYLRRFGKGAALVLDHRTEIDIHRTISPGPFGVTLDPDRFFDRESRFVVGGRLMSAPALEERLLHACHHAVLGDAVPRLLALRDVAQILTARPVDHDRLVRLARDSGGEAVVARAVDMTWRVFGLDRGIATARWAGEFTPDRRASRLMDLYAGHHRSSSRLTLETACSIRPPRDRAAFLFATVFPVGQSRRTGLDRWRSGARSLLRSGWTR